MLCLFSLKLVMLSDKGVYTIDDIFKIESFPYFKCVSHIAI